MSRSTLQTNIFVLVFNLVQAFPALGAGTGAPFTHPDKGKINKDDPLKVNPGLSIPEHPEDYTWKVTGKVNGKVVFAVAAPVIDVVFDHPVKRGTIPVGTEVKLEFLRRIGHFQYFAVQVDGQTLWLNGLYIEAAAYTPAVK